MTDSVLHLPSLVSRPYTVSINVCSTRLKIVTPMTTITTMKPKLYSNCILFTEAAPGSFRRRGCRGQSRQCEARGWVPRAFSPTRPPSRARKSRYQFDRGGKLWRGVQPKLQLSFAKEFFLRVTSCLCGEKYFYTVSINLCWTRLPWSV